MTIDKKILDAVIELRNCKKCANSIEIGNSMDDPEVYIGFPMQDLDIGEKPLSKKYSLQFSLSIELAEWMVRELPKSIRKAKKNIKKEIRV